MVEPSTAEDVPALVSEDKTADDLHSTPQQLEKPGDPPLADNANTENGVADKGSAGHNGAAVEGSVATEDAQTMPAIVAESEAKSKAKDPEAMPNKPPASPAKRLNKSANPTKPGTAPAAKPGNLGTSVKKVC